MPRRPARPQVLWPPALKRPCPRFSSRKGAASFLGRRSSVSDRAPRFVLKNKLCPFVLMTSAQGPNSSASGCVSYNYSLRSSRKFELKKTGFLALLTRFLAKSGHPRSNLQSKRAVRSTSIDYFALCKPDPPPSRCRQSAGTAADQPIQSTRPRRVAS